MRISSASISARWMTGTSRWRAATISALSCATAEERTTTSAVPDVFRAVADGDRESERAEPPRRLRLAAVRPGDHVAQIVQDLGDAAHPDAADAHEVNLPNLLEHDPLRLGYQGDPLQEVHDPIRGIGPRQCPGAASHLRELIGLLPRRPHAGDERAVRRSTGPEASTPPRPARRPRRSAAGGRWPRRGTGTSRAGYPHRRQFEHRAGAGAADDEIRRLVGQRHIVEERLDPRRAPRSPRRPAGHPPDPAAPVACTNWRSARSRASCGQRLLARPGSGGAHPGSRRR